MNKEQKNRFRIGEVAQMYHISMGTLRHYEKEGLVQPEYIDPENGYRYYGVCQLEVLNTIRYLRTLDMPLEEIREFIQNRDIPVIEEKLKKQKELIGHKRRELEQIERKIDHRLRQIEDAKQAAAEIGRAVFEVTPAIRIARIQEPMENRDLGSYLGLEFPIQRLSKGQEKSLVFMGKVGVGIEKEHLMQGKLDCYDFVFLVLDPEDVYFGKTEELPETLCACLRFRGSHREAPKACRCLLEEINRQGFLVDGCSREIVLADEGITGDARKFVTEIRIPVKKQ